jgi:hypothetical protein
MITLMTRHLNDEQRVNWPNDSELVAWLDLAADFVSEHLIADKDPAMLRETTIPAEGAPLPDDFVAFAGKVPASVVGRGAKPYAAAPLNALYWARLERFSSLGMTAQAPYTHEQALLIVEAAAMFALNKNEYDISQDMTLLADMRNAWKAARGAGS